MNLDQSFKELFGSTPCNDRNKYKSLVIQAARDLAEKALKELKSKKTVLIEEVPKEILEMTTVDTFVELQRSSFGNAISSSTPMKVRVWWDESV